MRTHGGATLLLAALACLACAGPLTQAAGPHDDGARLAAVRVALPASFGVAEGVMLSGHLERADARLSRAVLLDARDVTFDAGTLTVCPVAPTQGALMALQDLLAGLSADCPQGESFAGAEVRFGQGTDVATNATMRVTAFPAAVIASFARDGTGGLVMSADGIATQRPEAGFAFIATRRDAQVVVTTGTVERTYNGTGHAFLHDGEAARWRAGAVAAQWPGAVHLELTPAGPAIREAMRPFDLLDVQEVLRGADRREPRSNVSTLLYEHGRVPAFLDGAILGRLDGEAGGTALDGGVALVRGGSFALEASGDSLAGTFAPRLTVAAAGVAVHGGPALAAPWWVGGLLWALALLVLGVRRLRPVRALPARATWWVAVPLAVLIVDQAVVGRLLGASALSSWASGAPPGEGFAIAAFATLTALLAWALVALPARLVVGRFLAARWMAVGEGAVAVAWLAALAVFPGAVFALGNAVARV